MYFFFYFLARFIYDLFYFEMKGTLSTHPLLRYVIHYIGMQWCALVREEVQSDQDGYMFMHMYPNQPYTLRLTIYDISVSASVV